MSEKTSPVKTAPVESSPVETGSAFLKSARDIAFIIAIYLYFAGWLYIYTYFDFFGLSIRQTDIEFYYFLVYSINVLNYLIISHWLITISSILVSIAIIRWVKHTWVTYIICILLFALIYYMSILAARSDARKDFSYRGSTLLRIKFVLKVEKGDDKKPVQTMPEDTSAAKTAPTENISNDFAAYNEQNKLRLLLTTKDEYLVIAADRSVTYDNADSKDKNIYTVKKENINLVRIIK